MAKRRVDNHLKEDASELLISKLLSEEWVIRKLHPDYRVDVSTEVFKREGEPRGRSSRPSRLWWRRCFRHLRRWCLSFSRISSSPWTKDNGANG